MVSRSQSDLLTAWYDGRAEIIPFWYMSVLLGGKGTSLVGWDTGDLPSQGEQERERERGREGERRFIDNQEMTEGR
jgi:hypothetical protein